MKEEWTPQCDGTQSSCGSHQTRSSHGRACVFFVQHPWTVAEVLRAFLASSFLLDIVNHAFAYSTNVVGAFDTDELVLGFQIGIQSKR